MRQAFALIISIALGLLAVFAMKNYINQEKKAATRQEDMVEVLFSKRQMTAKTILQRSDVESKYLPSSSVTPDMVKPHEIIEIVDRPIEREVNRGGPLFHSDFLGTRHEQMTGLATGRRWISVPVNQVNGVSGLIHPGNRVDILYTQAQANDVKLGQNASSTVLLLENMTVHATDSQTLSIPALDKKNRNYSTLTLNATPLEAAVLTAASKSGTLTFMIRSKDDFEPSATTKPITAATLEAMARQANAERWKSVSSGK
jgi:pilus assembly protein CpaB